MKTDINEIYMDLEQDIPGNVRQGAKPLLEWKYPTTSESI